MAAWSLADLIRFIYYFFKELNRDIYVFKWLRYSAFIVLYPVGIFHEFYSLYESKESFFNSKLVQESPKQFLKYVYYGIICIIPPCIIMYIA